MQTFVPEATPEAIAAALDWRRLNKQVSECLQILKANIVGGGWSKHPATVMWRGHERALIAYARAMVAEWQTVRGYDSHHGSLAKLDALDEALADRPVVWPTWWGDPEMIRSHRSSLIERLPEHYGPQWPDVEPGLPLVWPSA